MEQITSRQNPRIKHARGVRDRKEPQLVFVEGVRLVREALRSGVGVVSAFMSDSFSRAAENSRLSAELEAASPDCFNVSEKVADSLADTKNSQGVYLICERPRSGQAFEHATDRSQPFVYLHEINNPSNLGALLRTAEAAGVTGVLVGPNSADPYSPKSLRASMGSAFRIPIREGVGADEAIGWAAELGLVTTAADVKGSEVYWKTDWTKPRLIIFGSEAHGIPDDILPTIDDVVRIPLENTVESLNLAASAAVILFEALRQRRSN